STRIEYAGPTLCEPVGKRRPESTMIGVLTPVSASGSTVCGIAPSAFHERLNRFSGSSGRSRAARARSRTSGGGRVGSRISWNVGPKNITRIVVPRTGCVRIRGSACRWDRPQTAPRRKNGCQDRKGEVGGDDPGGARHHVVRQRRLRGTVLVRVP